MINIHKPNIKQFVDEQIQNRPNMINVEMIKKLEDHISKITSITEQIGILNEFMITTIKQLNQLANIHDTLANYHNEFLDLKDASITIDDMNDLVADIKSSFEIFINATPRPVDETISKRLDDIESRIKILDKISIIETPINNISVPEETTEHVKKSIPKLNISKKKN